jgi:hypothetical protein
MKRTGRIGLASLFFVGLVVSMFGCLNVNQTNVPVTNFTSNVMFVDLANTSNMVATYDSGTVAASLAYGNHSAYVIMPAGSRKMVFEYGTAAADTFRRSFSPYGQYTYYSVFEPANGDVARTYVLTEQSYDFPTATAGVLDTALVRFSNLSSDTVASFADGLDFLLRGNSVATGVAFGGTTSYVEVPAGSSSYEVFASDADTTGGTPLVATTSVTLQSQGRYSIVVYGNHATIKNLVLQEH